MKIVDYDIFTELSEIIALAGKLLKALNRLALKLAHERRRMRKEGER